jgi:MYXO-CTERM domain-containing protein
MTMRTHWWVGVTLGLAAQVAAVDVWACGGCFGPPPPTPRDVQVVTDHRMVLALSATQTTLWDQFAYSGRPSEFSWILPIRYTAALRVAIADDGFLSYVNNVTAPRLLPPPFPWAPCPQPPNAGGFADAGAFSDAPSAADTSVTVLRMEVVGPYSVSVIRGTDPMAIRDWLRTNGYSVPAELGPVIDFYTAMNMDYVALRLRPDPEGIVPRMQPVRVTMEGYVPRLPLRMIAAGVADKVGLSLVVFGASRIEASNFPNGELSDASFTWDWAGRQNAALDYLDAFDALNLANGRRLWLSEVAGRMDVGSWFIPRPWTPPPASDASVETTPTDPMDDLRVITSMLSTRPYVTRLRADLPAIMLDRDLELAASDRGDRAALYQYARQTNIPPRPVCLGPGDGGFIGNDVPVVAPTADAGVAAADAGVAALDAGLTADAGDSLVPATAEGGASCSAQGAGVAGGRWGAWALGALAAVALRRRRRA